MVPSTGQELPQKSIFVMFKLEKNCQRPRGLKVKVKNIFASQVWLNGVLRSWTGKQDEGMKKKSKAIKKKKKEKWEKATI